MHPVSKVKALGGATQRADMMYYRLATDCLFFENFGRRQANPANKPNSTASLHSRDLPQAPRSGADIDHTILHLFEDFGRRQANPAIEQDSMASLYSRDVPQAPRSGAAIGYTIFGVPASGSK
ncbi:hypothetical protein B0H15DRAFT_948675 [Mycena belliarum]|uniref:Uncharacterized protein n=1 Tax=Mycena belliarum TaxID=1033014 RepID=A0AAD6U5R6_9AGAR|nr:hypothetical protein B0H15DRAFT_948675 [Mycena belliae]